MRKRGKYYIVLQILFVVYSLSGVFSKKAALVGDDNLQFILFYGIGVFLLAIYAIGWQKIIRRLPLIMAYSNKAAAVVWSLIWSVVCFGEQITVGKIVGVIMVFCGIVIFALSDK